VTEPVFVDKHVLQATAEALTNLAADLPGLLSAADGLGVGGEVGQLRAAPTWASEIAVDLRARIGLVERLEHGDTRFTSFTVSPEMLRQMAGGSMPVDEQLYALEAAERTRRLGDHSGLLDWDGSQDFSDWIEKVEARALAHLPLLDDKGELIQEGIHAFDEYQSLLQAGGMASLAVANLSRTQGYSLLFEITSRWGDLSEDALRARGMVHEAYWLRKGIDAVDGFYLSGRRTLFAPGTTLPWLKAQAVKYVLKSQTFEQALAAARSATLPADLGGGRTTWARFLSQPFVRDNMDRLVDLAKAPEVGRIANITGNVFGRPWTTTVLRGGQVETLVVARNATNLLEVARADGLLQSVKVAGGLRALGVLGGAFATADSVMGLANGWDRIDDNWDDGAHGKAKVIGDFAEVGFNASLTAAMIAPNPVTWGAVAVTGVVYGGARLVEHWDDVTDAVGEAVDWAGDQLDDAADAVGDTVSDGFDAVKDSKLNPGNWF
jgi:hypothetical protein